MAKPSKANDKDIPAQNTVEELATYFSGEAASSNNTAVSIVNAVQVQVKKLPHYGDLPDLKQATIGSVGIDLYAAVDEAVCLNKLGVRALIPTGIAIALPIGFEAQIRPRSGLAAKDGVTILNTPGTIDSDYRGEIQIILINLHTKKFFVERGMRIAQMIIKPVLIPVLQYVDELNTTIRGEGGFGSSGR